MCLDQWNTNSFSAALITSVSAEALPNPFLEGLFWCPPNRKGITLFLLAALGFEACFLAIMFWQGAKEG